MTLGITRPEIGVLAWSSRPRVRDADGVETLYPGFEPERDTAGHMHFVGGAWCACGGDYHAGRPLRAFRV